jgi:hypothetical protein
LGVETMSQAASQAAAFYRDVAETGKLWTLEDDGGYPAPKTQSGERSMPFWSSLARVKRIIKTVPAYSSFRPVEMSWEEFLNDWVPGLTSDRCLVGVNWSGKHATGYDCKPHEVVANVSYYLNKGKVLAFPDRVATTPN